MATFEDSVLYSWGTKFQVKIYYDDTNHIEYICDASYGTPLTAAKWRVRRITKDATDRTLTVKAAWSGEFNQVATDQATVEALTYA